MKKSFILSSILLIVFALSANSILACLDSNGNVCDSCSNCINSGMTTIEGAVYQGTLANGISGAHVTVICHHGSKDSTRNALSLYNGKYFVLFPQDKCDYGDSVTVIAEKDGLTGTNGGSVDANHRLGCFDLNVGIVNVPLVPEFGIAIGTLTALSAIGIFFFVRKK